MLPERHLDRHRVDFRRPDDVLAAISGAGIALLDGINDRHELIQAAGAFMRVRNHRDAEADHVTDIRPDREREQRTAGIGFSHDEVKPHTEGTSLPKPPELLLLACAQPAVRGGATILVDGAAVYRDLSAAAPDALAALTDPNVITFGTNRYRAPVFNLRRSGRPAIRYRDDDLIEIRDADQQCWESLRATVKKHRQQLQLKRGEGILVDNTRWLHGRTEFSGDRHMYRLIGERRENSGTSLRAQLAPPRTRGARR